ncbi:hypothetical protein B566_EDAN002229 [Ephemera danica]|nr:hypothetical protein B566_EDAN002229 [Ephemera danica]
MLLVNSNADAEVVQDILTCGACQKPFALADICKFIQHKVLSCNKENYSLGYQASEHDPNTDSEGDGGGGGGSMQPLSVNSRRPSISAPISGKKGATPAAATAPASGLLLDASAGLEERLGATAPPPSPQHPGASSSHRAASPASMSSSGSRPASRSILHEHGDVKPRIKQERMELEDALKRRSARTPDVADAESNTTNSGKFAMSQHV